MAELADTLMDEGYAARATYNDQSALGVIAERPPVLLLGRTMPLDVAGIGAVTALQQRVMAFVAKPFVQNDLLRLVQYYLPVRVREVATAVPPSADFPTTPHAGQASLAPVYPG